MVTRGELIAQLKDYLHHRLSLERLVDWAEEAMREEEFEEAYFEELRDAVSRLGLADVRAFGLSWADCEEMLERLGYRVSIEISEAR
jgi:cobyrinic acid a,c-diamide synthase